MNLHVFPPHCIDVARMLAFHDHLHVNTTDRGLYESTNVALAEREWDTVGRFSPTLRTTSSPTSCPVLSLTMRATVT